MIKENCKFIKQFKSLKAMLLNFLYSYQYPLVLALVAILSYMLPRSCGLIGFSIFCIFAILSLIFSKDLTPFMAPSFMFIFCFNNLCFVSEIYFYVLCALVAIALIAHLYIYPLKVVYYGKLILPILLVITALFLGGMLSPYIIYYLSGLSQIISIGPVVLLFYFLFTNYPNNNKKLDIKKYITYLLIVSTFASIATMLWCFYKKNIFHIGDSIGWGSSNSVAALILLAVPCVFYFLSTTKHKLPYFILILVLLVSEYLTASDGALGVLCLSLPFMIIFTYKLNNNKTKFLYQCAILTIILSILAILFFNKYNVYDFISTSDSGRTTLYKKAIEMYLKYPIFGVGFGFFDLNCYKPALENLRQFNFHSIFFHTIGTMGTYGFLCYGYYYFSRYKILFGKGKKFNWFMLCSFSIFQFYALIDTGEFRIFPFLLMFTVMLSICEKIDNTLYKNKELKNNFYENKKYFFSI